MYINSLCTHKHIIKISRTQVKEIRAVLITISKICWGGSCVGDLPGRCSHHLTFWAVWKISIKCVINKHSHMKFLTEVRQIQWSKYLSFASFTLLSRYINVQQLTIVLKLLASSMVFYIDLQQWNYNYFLLPFPSQSSSLRWTFSIENSH
jgi:hypothetical protein